MSGTMNAYRNHNKQTLIYEVKCSQESIDYVAFFHISKSDLICKVTYNEEKLDDDCFVIKLPVEVSKDAYSIKSKYIKNINCLVVTIYINIYNITSPIAEDVALSLGEQFGGVKIKTIDKKLINSKRKKYNANLSLIGKLKEKKRPQNIIDKYLIKNEELLKFINN